MLHLSLVLSTILPPGGWTWHWMNAVIFYLPFFWWNICGFNGPVVADTDHYMNSHSVWTPAGLFSLLLSGLTLPLRTSKRLCWWLLYGWNMKEQKHTSASAHVCISIHLHLTCTPTEMYAKRLSFSVCPGSKGATCAHVDIRQCRR